tara:strand:+ start:689 stop:817 length:129 start_codon:yes stop_codon:yes gene_type:complete
MSLNKKKESIAQRLYPPKVGERNGCLFLSPETSAEITGDNPQ